MGKIHLILETFTKPVCLFDEVDKKLIDLIETNKRK